MSEIGEEELEILKHSFSRLVDDQISLYKNTRLMHSSSGTIIHGSRFSDSLTNTMIQEHLSKSEFEELGKFNQLGRKMEYVIGRILAKRCLCDLIKEHSIEHPNITIDNDINGRPFYNFNDSSIEFNGTLSISHKDEYVIVACSRHGNVGLDFERLTGHSGLVRRISKTHTNEDLSLFTGFLKDTYPDFNLEFVYTAIWSALEAGYKIFSSINSKSPLELKVLTEGRRATVVHLFDTSQFRIPVYFVYTGNYILTLAT